MDLSVEVCGVCLCKWACTCSCLCMCTSDDALSLAAMMMVDICTLDDMNSLMSWFWQQMVIQFLGVVIARCD